jgi:hypothetical protein
MLTKPTVFVLGAGASHDCGYPLASELMFSISDNSVLWNEYNISPNRTEPLYSIINCTRIDFERFCYVLKRSAAQSIDIFLENTPEYIDIGKCAIAAQLITYENIDNLLGDRDKNIRWYEQLFNGLGRRGKEFEESISFISFLTFNYDRSLEYYFLHTIENTFDRMLREASEQTAQINIIHLYGQLGSSLGISSIGRDYSPTLTPDIIRSAASQIIIPDKRFTPTKDFQKAYNLLHNAYRIVFLGFGFHPENIQRLISGAEISERCQIIGTSFGMGRAQVQDTHKMFTKPRINLFDCSILELFKNELIFE